MYQHLNHLVAQSAARERELDLQVRLRQQEVAAQRPETVVEPAAVPVRARRPRLEHTLVRLHLAHA